MLRSSFRAFGRARSSQSIVNVELGDRTDSQPVATELQLHNDSEFVHSCAANLDSKKGWLARLRFPLAEGLVVSVPATLADPNYVLTGWAHSCFPESAEFKEERSVAPAIQEVLDKIKMARLDKIKKAKWCKREVSKQNTVKKLDILTLPILQLLILLVIILHQLFPPNGEPAQKLCIQPPKIRHGASPSEIVGDWIWYLLELLLDAGLYLIAVLQSRLSSREWVAIAFLTSLHWEPRANLRVYAAAIIEAFNTMLYSFNLYLVIVDASSDPLTVVFNATALNFLLEIDNIVVAFYPRLQAHTADVLTRLGAANATYNDYVLFFTAPTHLLWAPFGLHRMQSTLWRTILRNVYSVVIFLSYMVHLGFYYLIIDSHAFCGLKHHAPNATSNGTGSSAD